MCNLITSCTIDLIDTMVRELCLLFHPAAPCGDHFGLLTSVYFCLGFCQESCWLFNTNELLNPVNVELVISSGVFHAFQCMAMQTTFLVQGINYLSIYIRVPLDLQHLLEMKWIYTLYLAVIGEVLEQCYSLLQ